MSSEQLASTLLANSVPTNGTVIGHHDSDVGDESDAKLEPRFDEAIDAFCNNLSNVAASFDGKWSSGRPIKALSISKKVLKALGGDFHLLTQRYLEVVNQKGGITQSEARMALHHLSNIQHSALEAKTRVLRELGEIEIVISAIEEDVQNLISSHKRPLETREKTRDMAITGRAGPGRGDDPPNSKEQRLPSGCPATFDRGESLEFSLDTVHAVIDKPWH